MPLLIFLIKAKYHLNAAILLIEPLVNLFPHFLYIAVVRASVEGYESESWHPQIKMIEPFFLECFLYVQSSISYNMSYNEVRVL